MISPIEKDAAFEELFEAFKHYLVEFELVELEDPFSVEIDKEEFRIMVTEEVNHIIELNTTENI